MCSHSKMYFESFSFAFWAVCQMLQSPKSKWKLKFCAPSYQLHTALVTSLAFPVVLRSCFDWQHLGLDFPVAENPLHSCFPFCDSEKVNPSLAAWGVRDPRLLDLQSAHSPARREWSRNGLLSQIWQIIVEGFHWHLCKAAFPFLLVLSQGDHLQEERTF